MKRTQLLRLKGIGPTGSSVMGRKVCYQGGAVRMMATGALAVWNVGIAFVVDHDGLCTEQMRLARL
jgi:hypothetical protein